MIWSEEDRKNARAALAVYVAFYVLKFLLLVALIVTVCIVGSRCKRDRELRQTKVEVAR
jgi:uncharacterized membrane protein